MKIEKELDRWMGDDAFKQSARDARTAAALPTRTRTEPGAVVSGFNGYIRITRIDIPFLDLLNLALKVVLVQAIIALPIALVLYLLLR